MFVSDVVSNAVGNKNHNKLVKRISVSPLMPLDVVLQTFNDFLHLLIFHF